MVGQLSSDGSSDEKHAFLECVRTHSISDSESEVLSTVDSLMGKGIRNKWMLLTCSDEDLKNIFHPEPIPSCVNRIRSQGFPHTELLKGKNIPHYLDTEEHGTFFRAMFTPIQVCSP